MVRFLRNSVVAKIAGADSSLLQISGDERKRVARVSELFSEEDLARHLQIMLRTHSELGYRQEQRFHLELGLLKMAHAQRLLPIEQLLSEAGAANPPRPAGKPSIVPEARKSEPSPTARPNYVSPFAADSARKGGSKPEQLSTENSPTAPSKVVARATNPPVVMGAAAPAAMSERVEQISAQADPAPESQPTEDLNLSSTVLDALGRAGHRVLVSLLDSGEWQVQGDELQIKVTASAAVVDMSLSSEAKRLLTATASQVLGRPVKLKVIPGSNVQGPTNRGPSNGGGRSRVEQDPVVRRMQEKFGAEIRTVIDYKERR
jgi:DNA polymerase-3 subunit gamma/tau